jgi:hypothetical protein
MKFLAQFQIKPVDHPDDGSRRARTQCFGKRPQGLFTVRSLDQNEARRIKSEAVETMSIKTAVAAPGVARHHQYDRMDARQAR